MFSRYSYFFYLFFFLLLSCANNSLLNQARECYRHGDYNKALQLADSVTHNEPDNMVAIKLKGLCNYKLGDWVAAFKYIQIACGSDSIDTAIISTRAYLLFEFRQPQLALKDYKYVLSQNLKNAYILNCIGMVYYSIHLTDSAMQYLDKAISADSDYSVSYFNKGVVFTNDDKDFQAISFYSKAMRKADKSPACYFMRAVSYRKIDSFKLAILDFDRAIKLKPGDTSYYYQRGLTYDKLNMHDSACNDWLFAKMHGSKRAEACLENKCK